MNRIHTLFEKKHENVLTVYITAGFPNLEDTLPLCEALQSAGVDMIEIGMPYSDPLADGPVIQQSSQTALANGMSLAKLFEQLQNLRKKIQIPVLLMGYFNPVMKYGVERFCADCARVGVDGLIIPDLPFDMYQEQYRNVFESNKLANVFLITPQSSESRIRQIDEAASGFIYMVSTASTTGARSGISDSQTAYFERIAAMNLRNPRQIGFGIGDAESFRTACQHAQGAIIGSALIKAISSENPIESAVNFVKSIR